MYQLIDVMERNINAPAVFETHEAAVDEMLKRLARVRGMSIEAIRAAYDNWDGEDYDDNADFNFVEDGACTELYGNNYDWKIVEVEFPSAGKPESESAFKMLLEEVLDNDISAPVFFDTHEEAVDEMLRRVAKRWLIPVEQARALYETEKGYGSPPIWFTKDSAHIEGQAEVCSWKITQVFFAGAPNSQMGCADKHLEDTVSETKYEAPVANEHAAVLIYRSGKFERVPFCEIQRGDVLFRDGKMVLIAEGAHDVGDASCDTWVCYDNNGDSYFPGDVAVTPCHKRGNEEDGDNPTNVEHYRLLDDSIGCVLLKQENLAEFVGQVIDGFEDFLTARGIVLSNPERDEAVADGIDPEEVAIIYGSDFGELQTFLEDTIRNWGLVGNPDRTEVLLKGALAWVFDHTHAYGKEEYVNALTQIGMTTEEIARYVK